MKRNYVLYIMSIPIIVYFVLFCYLPMFGLLISFQDFNIIKGVFNSPWTDMYGFAHFYKFFTGSMFWPVMKNTLLISFYEIIFSFPAPIIFALMLNEIKNLKYKKIIQTVTYLPHFISVVVICSMIIRFFQHDGIITSLIALLGGERRDYIIDADAFRTIYVGTGIWQGIGWGSIIYISALSSIDQELYEAAVIDGAGKWKQLIHITIPGIASTIIILFIMRMGQILSVGYEKIILLQRSETVSVSRVLSVYTYERGLGGLSGSTVASGSNQYSYASAVGVFTSLVNILFLAITNKISKKVSETSLF
ncbi:MAG: sugar ABC transporter permease [Ruminococcaceae bacterium]|nr:sugar ABC transporter permease [Oscillospiraceae bacterium]